MLWGLVITGLLGLISTLWLKNSRDAALRAKQKAESERDAANEGLRISRLLRNVDKARYEAIIADLKKGIEEKQKEFYEIVSKDPKLAGDALAGVLSLPKDLAKTGDSTLSPGSTAKGEPSTSVKKG